MRYYSRGLRGPIQYTGAPGPYVTVADFNLALQSPGAASLAANPYIHGLALDPAAKVALQFDPTRGLVWFNVLATNGTTQVLPDDHVDAATMQALSDVYGALVQKVGATVGPPLPSASTMPGPGTGAQRAPAPPTGILLQKFISPAGSKFITQSGQSVAYTTTGIDMALWGLSAVSSMASAYHGYKRNNSIGWAIWWGIMGAMFPIITPGIALAEGFGKRAGGR